MNQDIYELFAQGLRYWLAILVVYILIRVALSVRAAFSQEKRIEKQKSGDYTLGVLEVIEAGGNAKLFGKRFLLRQENKIGKSSNCDIRIQENSIQKIQARIYQKGSQVYLSDYGTKSGVGLNGYKVHKDVSLMDGDEIQISNVYFLLSLKHSLSSITKEREQYDLQDEEFYDESDHDSYDPE